MKDQNASCQVKAYFVLIQNSKISASEICNIGVSKTNFRENYFCRFLVKY